MSLHGAARDLIVVDSPRSGGMIGTLEGLRSAIFEVRGRCSSCHRQGMRSMP